MRKSKMAWVVFLVVIFVPLLSSMGVEVRKEKRVALVIGNGAYHHAEKLPNPPEDARAVAIKLRKLGFDVVEGLDLNKSDMEKTIRRFADKLEGASVNLFFYAGHGLQVNGINYLAPVDAKLSTKSGLNFETIPMDLVMRQMDGENRLNLVFLDACRNNPLAENLARSMGLNRSVAGKSGLAQEHAGVGTLIAYATQPGNVASDGEGMHSPFTQALLAYMDQPGLEVRSMMTQVRKQVSDTTKGAQIPWDHSSLMGDFCLAGCLTQNKNAQPVQKVIADDLSDLPGLSAEFKQKYQLAAAKASEGSESSLADALVLVKSLVPLAISDMAADRVVKLGGRIKGELDKLAMVRQERERVQAERRKLDAEEKARQLAEEQQRLDDIRRQAEVERQAAEEKVRRLAAEEFLKQKKEQVEGLLRQVKIFSATGDGKGAAEKLKKASELLPNDPEVVALMKKIKIGPEIGDKLTDPVTGMEFMWVPGGSFQMGCGSWSSDCDDNEKPVHKVTLNGFWMGKTEVTQGQWKTVIGSNPSKFQACGDNCPVEKVSWNDVQAFIKKLNVKGDGKYRMPTEAEWEYACRSGGKSEKYCGGNDLDRVAWYKMDSGSKTHRVGTKAANGLGLFDMTGNVWEWVQDWYAEDAYSKHSSDGIYADSGSYRVIRGGSWMFDARYLRSASRDYNSPVNLNYSLGARLARTF